MSSVASTQDSMMMRQLMQQQMQQMRQSADVNSSGGLDVEEFTSLLEQKPEASGRVSGTENTTEIFASIDLDGSGELSEAEMQSFHQDKMAEKSAPPGGMPPGGMISASMQQQIQQLQQDADTDGSGSFDIDEFTSLHEQVSDLIGKPTGTDEVAELFSAIDLDGSGELSEEELNSFHQDNMGRQGKMGGKPPGGMMSSSMQDLLIQLQEESTLESFEEAA